MVHNTIRGLEPKTKFRLSSLQTIEAPYQPTSPSFCNWAPGWLLQKVIWQAVFDHPEHPARDSMAGASRSTRNPEAKTANPRVCQFGAKGCGFTFWRPVEQEQHQYKSTSKSRGNSKYKRKGESRSRSKRRSKNKTKSEEPQQDQVKE